MILRKITLLRPNMGDYRSSDALPPLAMAILAARTPADIEINFYDDKVEKIPEHDCPDLVAISVETFTARRAYEIADKYRKRGVTVVMGGYHVTFLPEEALRHADAIILGDAEGSWEKLLYDIRNDGLQTRYHGGSALSLDDFRLNRSIFKGKRYAPVELIQYGRGCRFNCDFCSIHSFYQDNLRFRRQENITAELENLSKRKLLFFVDDNLFGSLDSLEKLLAIIKPLGLRWSCQISIDVARDEKLLDRMVDAGCVFVLIGFESLSKANLKQMSKPWNTVAGDYLSVVDKFHQRRIAVYGTFVFGYDQDTVETIQDSLDFAMQAKLEIANFNPLTPTPGSPLYNRLKSENRLISPQWWLDPDYRYGDPIFIPKSMSADDFSETCFAAKKAFYSWKSIGYRVLRSNAGLNLFRTSVVGLANIISRKEVMRKQYRALGA